MKRERVVRPWRQDPATLGKSMAALLGLLGEGKLVAGPYTAGQGAMRL